MKKRSFCTDALTVFLLALFWLLLLLGGILRLWVLLLLSVPFGVLAALRFFFDGERRVRENEVFLSIVLFPVRYFKKRRYTYADCPLCEAPMRFPRKKVGRFRVRCPRCGQMLFLALDGKTAKIQLPEGGREQ